MSDAGKGNIHVTRISGASVFGHSADHCDDGGCAGDEHYFSHLDAAAVEVGEVYTPAGECVTHD